MPLLNLLYYTNFDSKHFFFYEFWLFSWKEFFMSKRIRIILKKTSVKNIICGKVFPGSRNLAPDSCVVIVSRLMLAVIFSITPILYQSSSVCYAHSQMQKRSMVYLFWTMGYSGQAVRNKTFNSN